jgi:hypothetical protein
MGSAFAFHIVSLKEKSLNYKMPISDRGTFVVSQGAFVTKVQLT